ncbi:MAG: hypothetical protein V4636_19960 [Pseudomonadota bacterium]
MAKESVTCATYWNGVPVKHAREKREVHVNEHGQRYIIGDDKLRYRLDEFNEYEYRYGQREEPPVG